MKTTEKIKATTIGYLAILFAMLLAIALTGSLSELLRMPFLLYCLAGYPLCMMLGVLYLD